ncbi:hypothetical protein SLS58_006088 [Diplodia intermedia]|uniref:Uncharacterized protein n=1 Tax=Diplodia intermedia TaxID=856260 RepID=A0ABR3TNW0_9PEZI
MLNLIMSKFVAVVYGKPKKLARPSHKQPLIATPFTSPDKPDLELGGNTDKKLDKNRDRDFSSGHGSECDRNYGEELGVGHGGEASKQSTVSLEREIRLLQRQIKAAVAERNEQIAEKNKFTRALQKEKSEKAAADQEMQKTAKKNLALENRNALLDQELKKVQDKLDSTVVDLRKAQLNSFKQAQTGWFVQEDAEIHHTISQLYKDVRTWAKAYGVKSLEAYRKFSPDANPCLSQSISKIAFFNSWDEIFTFKHPFLILAALVSDILSTYIFEDYFWIFRNPGDPKDHGERANALRDTFSQLRRNNAVDAHTWRALLFRTVFPEPENSELTIWGEFPVEGYANLLNHFTGYISHGAASAFLREMGQDEKQRCDLELQYLIHRAITLFSRLKTQRADYVWNEPSPSLCTGFDVHSPKMAADRLVRLDDDEDESCNGKKIKIVVSPAVQKFGDSNGEEFENSRFITKAVVFLEA